MERKDFLTMLGMGAGSIVIASCLGACGKSDTGTPSTPTNPGNGSKLDFTIADVTANTDFNNKGWTIQQGVIIAKNGASYIALSAACTHEGNPLKYDSATNTFPCSLPAPTHGSIFDANGVKQSGPAQANLKKYSTTLTGNSLRVFEA